jgi:hypothetical protein
VSYEVDYYDVQAMLRDERASIMAEVRREILSCSREVMDEARREIKAESDQIMRVLDSRTAHLA